MSASSTPSCNPVLVEVCRGEVVESRHSGAVAVVDVSGRLILGLGDCHRPIFPRSAIKPVQALALVESGAWEAFGLGEEELALASASHSGTPAHTRKVANWLKRLELDWVALECGAHPPIDQGAARALMAAGEYPCPLHNNCSGKHAGFLTVARHLGVATEGYIGPDHPVQQMVSGIIDAMTDGAVAQAPMGTDGCGIPTFAIPLTALAMASARMGQPGTLPLARGCAAMSIVSAMRQHPDLVAGPGRLCSEVMRVIPSIAVKAGAEGVQSAILPELGLGVAIKIDDGAARAAEVALMAVLERLGVIDLVAKSMLGARLRPPVINVAGKVVGEIRPTSQLLNG